MTDKSFVQNLLNKISSNVSYLCIPDNNSVFFQANVRHHVQFWSPKLKLSFPVGNSREWCTDQERLVNITLQTCTENVILTADTVNKSACNATHETCTSKLITYYTVGQVP